MPSRPVSGWTGGNGFRTKRTRQRLAMVIVSCSVPTTPGQIPRQSSRPFRSCRAHQLPRRPAGNKVQEDGREAAE
ncbi:unnamed protein product [Strongylus vulgaris]|uniref:Uncharacterized protein n=1 Tax=Strongylus vulgaris TaxID=40348 RepID=A0A3P7IYV6_STRVU|nr:unnamed protein product [Strongylus vulgaris]